MDQRTGFLYRIFRNCVLRVRKDMPTDGREDWGIDESLHLLVKLVQMTGNTGAIDKPNIS